MIRDTYITYSRRKRWGTQMASFPWTVKGGWRLWTNYRRAGKAKVKGGWTARISQQQVNWKGY